MLLLYVTQVKYEIMHHILIFPDILNCHVNLSRREVAFNVVLHCFS